MRSAPVLQIQDVEGLLRHQVLKGPHPQVLYYVQQGHRSDSALPVDVGNSDAVVGSHHNMFPHKPQHLHDS